MRDRLQELLPDAEIAASSAVELKVKLRGLDGAVSISALASICHDEDRSMWGPIAGSFCNLVVSRVNAHFADSVADPAALNEVLPNIAVDAGLEDVLIAEASPLEDLVVAREPWLDGLRVEFDYRQPDGEMRQLFRRDLAHLGVGAAEVADRAVANMARLIHSLPITPAGPSEVEARVLAVREEGAAPAMLRSPAGHEAMFAALERRGQENVRKVLACIPRSDLLLFSNVRDRAATSAMVARAWAALEADDAGGVPLTPRLFAVDGPGQVKYFDVGVSPDRVPDWKEHPLGAAATLRVPEEWWFTEREDRWLIWPGAGGPRIRARLVSAGAGSPSAASQLAERVRAKHQIEADVSYGYFNGCAWAWIDTGHRDAHATASMFVTLPTGIAILQTEVPDGTEQRSAVTLQKIIATIRAT